MKREKLINICDKIIAFSYYTLVYFLPISIALSESFAGATLFFFFVKRGLMFSIKVTQGDIKSDGTFFAKARKAAVTFIRSFKPVDSYLNRPLGFFILICALSILVSDYLTLSLQGFFFKVLQWTFLYFVFIEAIKTRKQLMIFISVFLVSAFVVSLNGLVQYFAGEGFIFHHPLYERVNSSFRHANDFGAYLTLVCPFLMCLLFCDLNKIHKVNFSAKKLLIIKAFLLILFLVTITSLGLTYSRGAWYSFFGGILLLGWYKKRIALVSALVIILFIGIFSPMLKESRNLGIFADNIYEYEGSIERESIRLAKENGNKNNHVSFKFKFKQFLRAIKVSSLSGREGLWKDTISVIKRFPTLGTGVNTYSQVAHQYKLHRGGYPHNSYLHMAAEIGILGLGVFMWSLTSLFINTLKNVKITKDSYLASISMGFIAGLFSFWIHSFFDTNFYSVQLANIMWVAMGALVASQKISLQDA